MMKILILLLAIVPICFSLNLTSKELTYLKGQLGINQLVLDMKILKGEITPKEFLDSLSNNQPENGRSFQGHQLQEILSRNYSLVVEIKNYMHKALTHTKIRVFSGPNATIGPNTIAAKQTELVTFGPSTNRNRLEGVIKYKVGRNVALHLYFDCSPGVRTYAAAFVSDTAELEQIQSVRCDHYEHVGKPGSYRCSATVPWEETESLIVNGGNIYAEVAYKPRRNETSTLTVQVFKIEASKYQV